MSNELTNAIVAILIEKYDDGEYIPDNVIDWMNENGAGIEYLES